MSTATKAPALVIKFVTTAEPMNFAVFSDIEMPRVLFDLDVCSPYETCLGQCRSHSCKSRGNTSHATCYSCSYGITADSLTDTGNLGSVESCLASPCQALDRLLLKMELYSLYEYFSLFIVYVRNAGRTSMKRLSPYGNEDIQDYSLSYIDNLHFLSISAFL